MVKPYLQTADGEYPKTFGQGELCFLGPSMELLGNNGNGSVMSNGRINSGPAFCFENHDMRTFLLIICVAALGVSSCISIATPAPGNTTPLFVTATLRPTKTPYASPTILATASTSSGAHFFGHRRRQLQGRRRAPSGCDHRRRHECAEWFEVHQDLAIQEQRSVSVGQDTRSHSFPVTVWERPIRRQ